MKQITITNEVKKFESFIDEKENLLVNLIHRINGEFKYEGAEPYKEFLTKLFNDIGSTKVTNKGKTFTLMVQLNNFQIGKLILSPNKLRQSILQKY